MSKKALVATLREKGLHSLALRAESGEFSDFATKHATPVIMLVRELERAGEPALAERAKRGDFDHDR